MKTIKLNYFATRPYSRLYVGFTTSDLPHTDYFAKSDHFDKQYDNKWYNVVAHLVFEFMKEYPNYEFEYCDTKTEKLSHQMTLDDVKEVIIRCEK